MDGSLSIQLVDGDGQFNSSDLENFARSIKLAECGLSYAVVSIMGRQSSGIRPILFFFFLLSDKPLISLYLNPCVSIFGPFLMLRMQ